MPNNINWFVAIPTAIVLVYLNLVLSNVVSYRNLQYTQTMAAQNKTFEPLYDTLFIDFQTEYNVYSLVNLTLREIIDICTYTLIFVSIPFTVCRSKHYDLVAHLLACELIIVPLFGISQCLTIVPDSTPNCVEVYKIPTQEDWQWIFWRYPFKTCGNMIWSSDITQAVLFTRIIERIIHRDGFICCTNNARGCCCCPAFVSAITRVCTISWCTFIVLLVFFTKYQYSVDVFVTLFVVTLTTTHPRIKQLGEYLFVKNKVSYEQLQQEIEIVSHTL